MLNFGLFANCLQIEKAPEQRCALRPLFLWAPPAVLFSNQFYEDARKLYELTEALAGCNPDLHDR